jgi:membrane-bound lytic murein transglycosylase B
MLIRTLTLLLMLTCATAAQAQDTPKQSYAAFIEQLWPDAKAKGVTRATFDLAFDGLTPDERVIKAIKRQPEYGKPFGDYVNSVVNPRRIAAGQRKAAQWNETFTAVEKRFQVDRWILTAIWGIETDFGGGTDNWDVFRSISTVVYAGYRVPYFRNELLVALKIMQDNNFARKQMVSSWAGAMGQTQFMPSNFVDYAIDFSGDGKADIWNNVPDVLGSTGNYLKKFGWTPGLPWGFEVAVPENFDYRKSRGSFADWSKLGVKRADGKPFPASGDGILFFPAGYKGPGFIVTKNFDMLKEYNNSDAYSIAVGHLADRIAGGGPIHAAWPAGDHQLSREARIAFQKKLAELGYKVNEFEGHVDFDLRDNIRSEQLKFGMVPDGTPTTALLEKIGAAVTR